MNSRKLVAVVVALVLVAAGFVVAQDGVPVQKVTAQEVQANRVVVPVSGLIVGGTAVSLMAAQLNALAGKGTTGLTNVTITAVAPVTNVVLNTSAQSMAVLIPGGATNTIYWTNTTITVQTGTAPSLTLQR